MNETHPVESDGAPFRTEEPVPSSNRAKSPAEIWLEENQAAIDGYNAYVDREGLPLPIYRDF